MVDIVTRPNYSNVTSEIDIVFDRDWAKSSFLLTDSDFNGDNYIKWVRKNRYFTTADFKFNSTAPGMSIAVNPKPQFTRYADIRHPGRIKSRPNVLENLNVETAQVEQGYGLGLGRYYSEAIDDNEQRIFLRFGVAKYMPLPLWIYKSFNIDKVVLANRGTITSTFIQAVGIVATAFAIKAAPILAIGMFLFDLYVQNSRFYYVKDTMYSYWSTVDYILNQMLVRRGLAPSVLPGYTHAVDNTINREARLTADYVSNMAELVPDIIDPQTGKINVFALALKGQKAFNTALYEQIKLDADNSSITDFTGYPEQVNMSHDTYFKLKSENKPFYVWLFEKAYEALGLDPQEKVEGNKDAENKNIILIDPAYTDEEGKPLGFDFENDNVDKKIEENLQNKKEYFRKFREYLLAELTEGAAFAIFNVENTGSVAESFSNSFADDPIETTFNSISAKSRQIGDFLSSATEIPVVGDVLRLAADTGAKILSSASFGIANPLLALAYGVNITMPKRWEGSNASLPRASYKIKLISPYGNVYSQMFNIYVPLAMILAGSLPKATGNSSYTSPFFCQLFDRGRVNINLGMIETVTITRGTSNLPFTRAGHPNAIDVDISIANLDEVVSIELLDAGVVANGMDAIKNFFNFSDNPFSTYINTLAGLDVYSQFYRIPNIRLKLAERIANIKQMLDLDSAQYGMMVVDKAPFGSILRDVLGNSRNVLDDLINR